MKLLKLQLRRFRGYEDAVVEPQGHVVLVGEPRAGRSDLIEGLRRLLTPDSTRLPLTDDLDFFRRDRSQRPEVEAVLGDLGPILVQQFLDHLEFWDRAGQELVEVLESLDPLADPALEPVLRLCYRAEWSDQEEAAVQWVDYPKSSNAATRDFARVRRADREALSFFFLDLKARPLTVAARGNLRSLIDQAPGADFLAHVDRLVQDLEAAAEQFSDSTQVQTALDDILGPAQPPMGTAVPSPAALVRFAPDGGLANAVLRALSPALDLEDAAGFLPLDRHGRSASTLVAVCELLALARISEGAVIAVDDFGEHLDDGTARHIAGLLRRQSSQLWLSTRRSGAALAFRSEEVVRLAYRGGGSRGVYPGWKPVDKTERAFARHFTLQVLPAMSARALCIVEGPHDRAAYSAVEERMGLAGETGLPGAHRVVFADAGAADASGGSSGIARLAGGARRLGFFTIAVIDGDKDTSALAAVQSAADATLRLPDNHAVERALLLGLDDADIHTAFAELDVNLPADFSLLAGAALQDQALRLLKKGGGLHAQFVDALPAGTIPPLARSLLERVVEAALQRTAGLLQL